MIPSEVLTGIWSEITEEGHSSAGFYFRRLPAAAAHSTFAGIHLPSGRRVLAVESPLQEVTIPKILNQSRGFTVASTMESIEGRSRSVISMIEVTGDSSGLFERVATDILNVVSSCTDAASIPGRILRRLENWHRFFLHDSGMGRQEYLGLCAELVLLEWLLDRGTTPERALSAWLGPLGGSQDFQLGCDAIEVKCSSSIDSDTVRISSTRQLDPTGLHALFLYHVSVDLREGSGRTLVSFYHELRNRINGLDPGCTALFEDLMLSAGFNEGFIGRFEKHGFTLRKHAFYSVRDGFPRINESSLAPGITDVTFSLDLASCQSFGIDESAVGSEIERAGGNG